MHELVHVCNLAGNLLLCALPTEDHEHLVPHLQSVTFSLGQTLYEPGQRIDHCYFPTNSVVSLLYTMQDGSTAEMGLVGNEGVLGIAAFLGGESTCSRALVTVAGNAIRLPVKLLQQEFVHPRPFHDLILRYIQVLITQVSQTAVCNRLHSMEQRLCRWLLLCHDRTYRSDLLMTQELIASMLGGRRESVAVAAGHLQDGGLIHYCRGRIRILDRKGLELNVCECYRVVEDEFGRLFGRTRISKFRHGRAVLKDACERGLSADQTSRAELGTRYSRRLLHHAHRGL
jgi:CRP-like cAMP-binding protein